MRTLILVEDELEIRRGMLESIPWSEIGFEVSADFGDGASAREWLQNNRVDVVVADIMMPNCNGIELAEYLWRSNRLETIIFFSAYRDFQFAQEGMKFGVKRYITKDMGYHEIVDVFRQVKKELDMAYHAETGEEREPEETDVVLSSLMRYLKHNYRTATLQTAADVVHMNPNYLSTYVKKHTGQNFKTILMQIRMEKAKELLNDPAYRIVDIRNSVGYTDSRIFIKCFKAIYHLTPGEYRRNRV